MIRRPGIKLKNGENPWITYDKRKIFKENGCINRVYIGEPGCGKSWALLSYCEQMDPNFKLEGNWFFKAKDLFRTMKDSKHPKGKIWVLDEAGIDLNNLSYRNEVNRGFNAFLQTGRHRNYILGVTLPYIQFLSLGVRSLMTSEFRCEGWNQKNQTKIIARILQYNGEKKKFYRKKLIVLSPNRTNKCYRILVPKPSQKLIEEYEERKKEFTKNLFSDIAATLSKIEKKEEEKKIFHHKCKFCLVEWEGKVEFPLRCPRCNKRLQGKRDFEQKKEKIGGDDKQMPS